MSTAPIPFPPDPDWIRAELDELLAQGLLVEVWDRDGSVRYEPVLGAEADSPC